jgi:NADH:ubiquinone oxidoreductase subunit E
MQDTKKLIETLAGKYGTKRESLIPIMQGIVEKESYLSKDAMIEVARTLDISAAEVYGTASFYSFLDTDTRGKYKIRVCKSIICEMKGKNEILRTIEDILKIKVGETSKGGQFTLLETNCLGWCHKGPAMLVNDEVYTELNPKRIRAILGEYIREEKI